MTGTLPPSSATGGERHEEGQDEVMVFDGHPGIIAAAQVHAVLALAAATALDSDRREWFGVAGSRLSDGPT